MKSIIEQIHEHRSIRKYIKDAHVSEELLEKILLAGIQASSSGNMQSYSIIITKDLEIRKKLYELHFQQNMVLDAPLLLTFCADFNRMRKWLKLSDAPLNFDNLMSFMIGAIDATLVSQNVALAAESEGLGICYMGTTLANCLKIAKILRCPSHVVPVVGFSLGYADESPGERKRLPLAGLIHKETYQDYSDQQIKNIYKEREDLGMKRYLSYPELREKIIQSGVKNLAQVYTKIKYSKESHEEFSQTILDCLKMQEFIYTHN